MPRYLGVGSSVLVLALYALSASAQPPTTPPAPAPTAAPAPATESGTVELDKIAVTGSRIPRNQLEGPSPVTIISRDQIDREGFTTVSEVLNSLTQVSTQLQNERFTNSFTPNARGVDLRGLGPGRTLVLLDGRRLPDYPLPYNSESNLVSLTSIPTAIVDRIEVLTGGASAIYGADAIAGVVNIILKKDATGVNADVRVGTTTEGGGDSQRVQVAGGFVRKAFSLSYAFEFLNRDALYDFERNNTDSVLDNPDASQHYASRNVLLLDPFNQDGDPDGFTYVDPGNRCLNFESVTLQDRPGRGQYCGSLTDVGDATMRGGQRNYSGFANMNYRVNDNLNAYGYVNYFTSKGIQSNGTSFFSANDGDFILDVNGPDVLTFGGVPLGGRVLTIQKIYAREENGSPEFWAAKPKEESLGLSAGLNGAITDTWRWDANWTWSKYWAKPKSQYALTDQITDYYLGPQLGIDPLFGLPMYALDKKRFYHPLTHEQLAGFAQRESTKANTESNQAMVTINGDLLQLPAGALSMAGIIEFARQEYELTYDENYNTDNYFPAGVRNSSDGKRDRYAVGVEFSVPIHRMLLGKAAARYDDYDDRSDVGGEGTYNLGLEFRPLSNLLFRGTYSTTFRAPDMYYLFAPEEAFFFSTPDYFLCRRDEPDTDPQDDCSNSNVNPEGRRNTADANLKAETGRTVTVGVVWDIIPRLTAGVDYFDIKLDDIVRDRSLDEILQTEADCRLGEDVNGNPVDITSGECVDVLSRIIRRPDDGTLTSEALDIVRTGPINQSLNRLKGIDANLNYDLAAGAYGKFRFNVAWSHILDNPQRIFETDETEDARDDQTNWENRSRLRGSINWVVGNYSSTVFATRTGSIPKGDPVNFLVADGRQDPVTIVNLNITNQVTKNIEVGLTVDNVFNKLAEGDSNNTVFPYYNVINYSNIGREVFLNLGVKF